MWMPDVAPYEWYDESEREGNTVTKTCKCHSYALLLSQSMDELRPEETRIVQVNSDGRAEYRFTLVLGCVCTMEVSQLKCPHYFSQFQLDDYPFDTQSCRTQFFVYQHKPETMRIVGQMRLSDNVCSAYGL